ncbi:hypothetical protein [Pinibacter aurantiacus]|uniref:Alpha/beta hydrolase n=1 Tax=Pinibacter aurantiacus TaxID=2851599 RepID=A0A9E2W9Y9_9BACT|nr:hypothetical protein [Pinibacter aurantiacus]MBV4360497.1 hypothetical protein [Pinibacter aurantiacus]
MPNLEKIYYVNLGKNGTFKPSGNEQTDTTATDLDSIIDHLRATDQKKIVLYFHGGLVSAASGLNTAERITGYVTDNTAAHPVSFVWETGLFETIKQNFDTIYQSEFFKKLLVKIIKVAGRQLGIDVNLLGVASKGISSFTEAEIEMELKKVAPFENYQVNEGKKSVSVNLAEAGPKSDEVIEEQLKPEVTAEMEEEIADDPELIALAQAEKPDEEAKLMGKDNIHMMGDGATAKGIVNPITLIVSAVKITVKVIRRHIKHRNHGFYPTIIEEILREFYIADIGSWLWSNMQEKAKNMWTQDDFSGEAENWYVGTYLLNKLKEYQDEVGELTIDLIGHSAGSIAIAEMLVAAKSQFPSLKFRDITYMAPAVRCDLFASNVLKNQDRFKRLRYFTMEDAVETKDHLVPVLYPWSLLYFISGLLENKGKDYDAPLLGLQRHTVGNPPYDLEDLEPIVDYLRVADTAIYSVTQEPGHDGFRSTSRKHGDFDNDEKTLLSIMYFINQP